MKKRIFVLAILLLTFASIAFGRWFPDIIVTGTDGIWTDTRFYADIDAAVQLAF